MDELPANLRLGLNKALAMQPGSANLSATIKAKDSKDVEIAGEVAAKLSPDWAAYGKIWYSNGTTGAGGVLSFQNKVDFFGMATHNKDSSSALMGIGIRL